MKNFKRGLFIFGYLISKFGHKIRFLIVFLDNKYLNVFYIIIKLDLNLLKL